MQTMAFSADMIVPREIEDDFGRPARPATTLLRYEVEFRHTDSPGPRLELIRESLLSLRAGDAKGLLGFPHSPEFRRSAVTPTRRVGPLISTQEEDGQIRLMLHQDGGSRGQPIPAGLSPRTVVGGTNAAEYPTVLAARREMASWQLLHLEPSEMRAPDRIGGPDRVSERGGHIAATLARLVSSETTPGEGTGGERRGWQELALTLTLPRVQGTGGERSSFAPSFPFLSPRRGPRGRAVREPAAPYFSTRQVVPERDGVVVLRVLRGEEQRDRARAARGRRPACAAPELASSRW